MILSNENEIQNKNPTIFGSKKLDQDLLLNREKVERDQNSTDEVDNLESISIRLSSLRLG